MLPAIAPTVPVRFSQPKANPLEFTEQLKNKGQVAEIVARHIERVTFVFMHQRGREVAYVSAMKDCTAGTTTASPTPVSPRQTAHCQ